MLANNHFFMKNIYFITLLICAGIITSCGGKQSQAKADNAISTALNAKDTTDNAATDFTEAQEEKYDFEAIAKAIEGCTYLYKFEDGVAFMNKDDQRIYIDRQGRKVDAPEDKVNPNALKARYKNGKYGFVDAKDNLVIPYRYEFALDFSDGMALVCNKNLEIGYINTKGELVIPYQYDSPAERNGNDFHEGLCAVMVDGEHEWFSYIDKTGKQAFPGVFSLDGEFSEGLAAVRTADEARQSGYIDHSGKMVITLPEGWWGRKFNDGVAQIQKRDSCFIIDKTGKRLFPVNSDDIYIGNDIVFSEGLAVVIGKGKYEKKWGFMDKTGRITFIKD